jgi:hypothetical protein
MLNLSIEFMFNLIVWGQVFNLRFKFKFWVW